MIALRPETGASPWRAVGLRTCNACSSASTASVDDWRDDVLIKSFGPCVKGAKCRRISAPVLSSRLERVAR
jgi:hypothetical protein